MGHNNYDLLVCGHRCRLNDCVTVRYYCVSILLLCVFFITWFKQKSVESQWRRHAIFSVVVFCRLRLTCVLVIRVSLYRKKEVVRLGGILRVCILSKLSADLYVPWLLPPSTCYKVTHSLSPLYGAEMHTRAHVHTATMPVTLVPTLSSSELGVAVSVKWADGAAQLLPIQLLW